MSPGDERPEDEFYVGYLKQAPAGIGASNRKRMLSCAAMVLAMGAGLAVMQQSYGNGSWDWTEQSFTGILEMEPAPSLVVLEKDGARTVVKRFLLVAPFKHGAGPLIQKHAHRQVTLKATRVERGGKVLLEMIPGSIEPVGGPSEKPGAGAPLGTHTFIGEIVDSKCYLGVMNPGHTKTHRACAVRCISGGIPPVLLVRDVNDRALYLLLVDAKGKPVNDRVLDLVAEPVKITGEVLLHDDLLVLRADPAGIKRVH